VPLPPKFLQQSKKTKQNKKKIPAMITKVGNIIKQARAKEIGHFQVPKNLTFKTRPSAQSFM